VAFFGARLNKTCSPPLLSCFLLLCFCRLFLSASLLSRSLSRHARHCFGARLNNVLTIFEKTISVCKYLGPVWLGNKTKLKFLALKHVALKVLVRAKKISLEPYTIASF
jgi:hypothetical protein